MGLGDFWDGAKHAAGKTLDVATDIASGRVADTAIDATTFGMFELPGKIASGAGRAVNDVADRVGTVGDDAQRWSNKLGIPKPIGSVANFALGGGAQWAGRSGGDLLQTAGFLGEHTNEAMKGTLTGANWAVDHPDKLAPGIAMGASWAANHKMDIAKGAGEMAVDSITDPATAAITIGTMGAGGVLTGLAEGAGTAAATAGTEALAEGGAAAATRAAAGAAARQIATNVSERSGAGLVAAGVEGSEATAAQKASALLKETLRTTYTGRNAPETAFDRAATKLSRNPTGRLSQARRGVAESLANWGGEGSLPRQIAAERLANVVEPGSTMPSWGGPAAANEWRLGKAVTNANRAQAGAEGLEETAKIAADPKGYAMNKIMGSMDTSTTGSVTSSTQASSAISGDLMEPGSTVVSGNQFAPKGPGRSFTGMKAPTDTTTGDSVSYEVRDPYAEGSAYGQLETGHTVKDPYKQPALTQPKEKPNGVLKPDKKAGVYA